MTTIPPNKQVYKFEDDYIYDPCYVCKEEETIMYDSMIKSNRCVALCSVQCLRVYELIKSECLKIQSASKKVLT